MSSLNRSDDLLELLSTTRMPLSFSDIVRALNLSKSSAHALLRTLSELGWIESITDGVARYRIGIRLVELASSRLNDSDAVRRFAATCEQFPGLREEALVLSVLDRTDVVYLVCRTGSRPLGVQYRIGMRLPAAFTASGKAILADYTDDQVRALFGDGPLVAPSGLHTKSIDGLVGELAQVRAAGYSMDDEETAAGMLCFGAIVPQTVMLDRPAAVATSLVKASVTPADHARLASQIKDLAAALR